MLLEPVPNGGEGTNYIPAIIAGILALGGIASMGAGVTLVVVENGEEEDSTPTVQIDYTHFFIDFGGIHPPDDVGFWPVVQGGDGDLNYTWYLNSTLVVYGYWGIIHFEEPGTYSIRVIVRDEDGDTGSDEIEITTGDRQRSYDPYDTPPGNGYPVGDFHPGYGYGNEDEIELFPFPRAGPAPLRVEFTIRIPPNYYQSIYGFELLYGDGAEWIWEGTLNNYEHEYNIPGNYTVLVSIRFRTGQDDDEGNPITVVRNATCDITVVPHVELTEERYDPTSSIELFADPEFGSTPLTVNFTSTMSDGIEEGGTYIWDFGDGERAVSAEGSIQHTYSSIGLMTAMVSYRKGFNMISDRTIINVSSPVTMVDTYAMIMMHLVNSPYDMNLSAWTSHPVLSYDWRIDGTSIGDTREVHHDFTNEDGIHYIRLDVVLNVSLGGGTFIHRAVNDTETIIVPGDDYINVYFEPLYSTVMTNELIDFELWFSGGDPPISFTWFFGDGGISHLPDPIYSYHRPGRYTIDLYIEDMDGDVGHCSHDIIVVERSEMPQ